MRKILTGQVISLSLSLNAQVTSISNIGKATGDTVQIQVSHHHSKPSFRSELKNYWKRVNTPGTVDYYIAWGGVGILAGNLFMKWLNHTPKVTPGHVVFTGQCSAMAASTGQRCKRGAESGNIYCWQHK